MAALSERGQVVRVRAAIVLICLVGTVVSGCSSSPSGDVTGSAGSAPQTLPASTSVIFLSFDRDVVDTTPFIARADARIAHSEARVADASGRDPQVFAARDVSIHEMWSSADGSVIAYVTEPGYGDSAGGVGLSIVSSHATRTIPLAVGDTVAAAVAPDGHAVYATMGPDVLAFDVATGATRTVCSACVAERYASTGLAVSADETRVATSSSFESHFFGVPPVSRVVVTDVATAQRLWTRETKDWVAMRVEGFVDNGTIVETVQKIQSADLPPVSPDIRLVSSLGSGKPVERSTGVTGYGPITRLNSQWWYARDAWDKVTSLYTNPDLTPAHETKVADRIDGTTSFGYLPVTSRPAAILSATDPPAASATSTR